MLGNLCGERVVSVLLGQPQVELRLVFVQFESLGHAWLWNESDLLTVEEVVVILGRLEEGGGVSFLDSGDSFEGLVVVADVGIR